MRLRRRVSPRATQVIGRLYWRRPKGVGPWLLSQEYTNSIHLTGATYAWPYYALDACLDEVHPGPPYLTGGPFEKWSSSSSFPDAKDSLTYLTSNVDTDFKYEGGFHSGAAVENAWFTASTHLCRSWPITLTNDQLVSHTWGSTSAYGAKAWTKFRPGESIADAAVFLGELTDVPRMLKTTASAFGKEYLSRFGRNPRGYAKNAADHWLNTQFGWLPFISDLRKFYKAWKVMDKWYIDLVRNNGQWVKRGGTVRKDFNEVQLASYGGALVLPNFTMYSYWNPSGNRGTSSITRVTRQRVWFEARYRYYVPEIESVAWKRKAIAHLFGADLNPAVIWELIPWSWLVDWFANVGNLVNAHSNTGLFANLATKYSHLMGKTEEVVKHDCFFPLLGTAHHLTWETSLSRKSRKVGGSFGFDLSDDNLSARQWSILSALGITRMR